MLRCEAAPKRVPALGVRVRLFIRRTLFLFITIFVHNDAVVIEPDAYEVFQRHFFTAVIVLSALPSLEVIHRSFIVFSYSIELLKNKVVFA